MYFSRRFQLIGILTLMAVPGFCANLAAKGGPEKHGRNYVRISAINGVFSKSHADQLFVHPGDVLRLSADVFDEQNWAISMSAANDFVWSEQSSGDRCDLTQNRNSQAFCGSDSNFEATEDGVIYHVPESMSSPARITVSVGSALVADLEEQDKTDSVILKQARNVSSRAKTPTLNPIPCPPPPPPTPCPVAVTGEPCPLPPTPPSSPEPSPEPNCPVPGPIVLPGNGHHR